MGQPVDAKALAALERQAEECERVSDFLGALDIYEEIDSRGWATAWHLVALGHCHYKNRQGKSAKEMWLRARALDPGCAPAVEALDRFFPGWDKQASSTATRGTAAAAPPPPPPPPPPLSMPTMASPQESALTMEVTTRRAAPRPLPAAPASAAAQAANPRPVAATPRPARPAFDDAETVISRRPLDEVRPPEPRSPEPVAVGENRVNWEYVLADASEEALYRK